jgi:succinoglycan biosynthesis protein ExoA
MQSTSSVSVIVPCRNEVRFIGRCLDSIRASDYPTVLLEVIVADGMSEDGTRQILARYLEADSRVRLVDNPERTTPAALNRAIEVARGAVILRLDAHAEMAPDYISKCVAALAETGAMNVGGVRIEQARDPGLFADAIVAALTCRFGVGNAHYRFRESHGGWVDTVFGGCWRREVFERVGKFNSQLERSQDIEFNQRLRRAGGRIWMQPDAVTYYFTRSRLGPFIGHNWTNGVWSALPFACSEVTPVRPRHLAPAAFVLATLALALAAMCLSGTWSWAPVLTLGPYALANVGASIVVALRQRSVKLAALLPVAFACLHFPYGAGSVWGALCAVSIGMKRRFHRIAEVRGKTVPAKA